MLTTLIGAVVTLIVAAGGWWLKLRVKIAAQTVDEVDHAMLQAEADRPDRAAAVERLRDGSV